MSGNALLTVSGLYAGYGGGELTVLEGVDLTVGEGEYVGVIGPNGAGKTTLLRAVFGLCDRLEGTIRFGEEDITGADTVDVTESGLVLTPQEDNVFPDLTVRENLKMGAYLHDEFPDDALGRVYDRFPILEERTDQKAGELSGGQQQMVAIGRALMVKPELLVLDEPSAGLAPNLVQDFFDEIDAINDAGTSILVVEQNAKEVLQRADRAYLISQGQIRREDDAETLRRDEDIQAEFFGGQ
ncbi:MAG: ABC transporter ATP-binding protein [Haloferacaceae archaeon]